MGRVSIEVTDMNKMLFYRLRTKPDYTLVCSDENYNYYNLPLNGYLLMFAKNRYRDDGLRLFLLNNELAKCLGFINYEDMRARLPKLQHSRKMLSANSLQRALM